MFLQIISYYTLFKMSAQVYLNVVSNLLSLLCTCVCICVCAHVCVCVCACAGAHVSNSVCVLVVDKYNTLVDNLEPSFSVVDMFCILTWHDE